MEIERKFDIKNIPSWMKEKCVRHKKIEQIYLMIDFDNDGKVLEEIRVWKAINLKTNQIDYKMTYKYGDGLSREEVETSISADFYEMIKKTRHEGYNPIIKDYYMVQDIYNPGRLIEVSEVDGKFCYAEVEFPDEKTANEYVWPYPEILGPKGEMTNQPNERMSVYWLKSRVS